MIADKEVIGRDVDVEVVRECSTEDSMGCWIQNIIKNNLKEYGDMNWMVSHKEL